MKNDEIQYAAFISYNHNERDKPLAEALAGKVESYGLPKQLRLEKGRKRIGRVYRDLAEASAGGVLKDEIVDALNKSAKLIVICSPRAKESKWVNEEVDFFLRHGRKDDIIPVLSEGAPLDAYPTALLQEDDENGAEYIAADFREFSLDKPKKLPNVELHRLYSGLLDVRYDEITQRFQLHQQRRSRLIATFSLAAVAVATLIALTMFSLRNDALEAAQNEEIRRLEAERLQVVANNQLVEAREQRSIFLAESSMDVLEAEGNPEKALLFALEALPPSDGDELYPQTNAAVAAARLALDRPQPDQIMRISADGASISPDGRSIYIFEGLRSDALLNVSNQGKVSAEAGPGWFNMGYQRLTSSTITNDGLVFQLTAVGQLWRDGRDFVGIDNYFNPPTSPENDYLHFHNSIGLVLARSDDRIMVLDPTSGETLEDIPTRSRFIRYGIVPGKNAVFYITETGIVRAIDIRTFRAIWEADIGTVRSPDALRVAYSEFGIAVANGRDLFVFEGRAGEKTVIQTSNTSLAIALTPNGQSIARVGESFSLTVINHSNSESVIDFGRRNTSPLKLGFMNGGQQIGLISRDGRLRTWSAEQDAPEFTVIAEFEAGIGSAAHSWDRTKVVISSSLTYHNREQIQVFDLDTFEFMWRNEFADRGYGFGRMAISNDGGTFVGGSVCACEGFVVAKHRGIPSRYEVSSSHIDYSDDRTRVLDAGFDQSQSNWFLNTTIDGVITSTTDFDPDGSFEIDQVDFDQNPDAEILASFESLKDLSPTWSLWSFQRSIDVNLDGAPMRQIFLAMNSSGNSILGQVCQGDECQLTFGRHQQGELLASRIVDLDAQFGVSADVSADGKYIVVAEDTGKTSVFDASGTLLNQIDELFGRPVFVSFAPDNSLTVATEAGTFFRWQWQNSTRFELADVEGSTSRCLDEFELEEAYFPERYDQRAECEPEYP